MYLCILQSFDDFLVAQIENKEIHMYFVLTTTKFTIGQKKFSCVTNKLIFDPGYTKFMTWQVIGKDGITHTK